MKTTIIAATLKHGIQKQVESGLWNPDIKNDNRNSSLQQFLKRNYFLIILYSWFQTDPKTYNVLIGLKTGPILKKTITIQSINSNSSENNDNL